MPIYEFECKRCREIFEAVCTLNGIPSACPACGSNEFSKLISAFGIGKQGLKLGELTPSEQRRAEAAIARSSKLRAPGGSPQGGNLSHESL